MQSSVAIKRRPRIFYGWYIVGASILMNTYLSLSFFQGFQVFFLPILNEFQWSRAATSGAFSLRQLETGVLAPLVGILADRWGVRRVIFIGVVIGGLGMMALAFINSIWTFYLAFTVVSIGVSGASHGVTWVTAVANWFRRLRGRALGLAMLGPVVAGPFVASVALLEEALGWRQAVFFLGVGLLIVGIPLSLVARSKPEERGDHPDGDLPAQEAAQVGSRTAPARVADVQGFTTGQALRSRAFWALSLVFGIHSIVSGGVMVHLIPLLEGAQYSTSQAAGILGMVFLLSGVGRMGVGIMVDWFDRRAVVAGLFLAMAVGLWVLTRISGPSWWQMSLFLVFYGVGFGGSIPLRPYLVREFFGARSFGSIQGLVQGVAIGAGVAGPVFYGWIFDVTESYDLALYVTIGMTVIAAPLALLLGSAPGGRGKGGVA